jgi:hypothetical protein
MHAERERERENETEREEAKAAGAWHRSCSAAYVLCGSSCGPVFNKGIHEHDGASRIRRRRRVMMVCWSKILLFSICFDMHVASMQLMFCRSP